MLIKEEEEDDIPKGNVLTKRIVSPKGDVSLKGTVSTGETNDDKVTPPLLDTPTEHDSAVPLAPDSPKRGRPPRKDIEAKKHRNSVGRPLGDASKILEMKARLLNSPKSRKVLDSIFAAALDDNHSNQSAAWKLLIERMLPMTYFEKSKVGGGGAVVNITVSGLGTEVTASQEPLEGEYADYSDAEED